MKTITHSEFAKALTERRGAIILGIIADTDARLLKTGNPFGEVRKVQHLRVVTGADYQRSVERQGGEGFKADGLPYGTFDEQNKVIKTKDGKLQLRTVFRNARKPIRVEYKRADTSETLAKELIQPWMPKVAPSKKQAAVGVAGKKEVKVRNFDFSNILEVRMNGEKFELVPDGAGFPAAPAEKTKSNKQREAPFFATDLKRELEYERLAT